MFDRYRYEIVGRHPSKLNPPLQQHIMSGKNSGVCHACRSVGHFFGNCPIKCRCPRCVRGFQKFFVVERDTVNKGKLFKCCSEKCGFWDWCKDGEATGESSNDRVTLGETPTREEVEDMSQPFQFQVRLNNEDELSISVNVIVRRGKSPI